MGFCSWKGGRDPAHFVTHLIAVEWWILWFIYQPMHKLHQNIRQRNWHFLTQAARQRRFVQFCNIHFDLSAFDGNSTCSAWAQFLKYKWPPWGSVLKNSGFSMIESDVFLFKGRREVGKEEWVLCSLDMEGTCKCKMPFIIIWYIAKYSNFI